MTLGRWRMRAVLALVMLLGATACSKREPRDDCGPSERVIDPALLAFLSQARSAHHVADIEEEKGDTAAALRALTSLTQAAGAPGASPEADEVLSDTFARSADLLSRVGRYDQAEEQIERGLERAKAPSYFRGHLFEVRGLLQERREKALRAHARGQEADQARALSLDAYEEAMKIQAEVVKRAAPAGSARPR